MFILRDVLSQRVSGVNDYDIIDLIRKVKKAYKMNSKANYNYLKETSFSFFLL